MKRGEIVVTRYRLAGAPRLKIALAADLHGRDPESCLRALRAEKPDLIAVAGDMLETQRPEGALNAGMRKKRGLMHRLLKLLDSEALIRGERPERGRENAMRFFREAAGIAPTYYAPGNHDAWLTREDGREIVGAGVVLLEDAATAFRRGDDALAIGGFCRESGAVWLRKFARRPGAKLLICHRPELYEALVRPLDIPIVLSGHAHGGQWRLFGRGVFAPGQGLFPRYTKGVYEGRLVVTAGLANTANVPRINNPVEIVIVEGT